MLARREYSRAELRSRLLAKGVGEPALVATAPAILNAIRHATGVRPTRVPVTPDRLRAALLDAEVSR